MPVIYSWARQNAKREASNDLLGSIRSVRRYTHEKPPLLVSGFKRLETSSFGRYVASNILIAYFRNSWLLCEDSENK